MGGVGSGNTPDYTEAQIDDMLTYMEAHTLPLAKGCQLAGIPLSSAWRGLERHPHLRARYDIHKRVLAEHYAQGSLDIVEEGYASILASQSDVDAKTANAKASATRNIAERRAWAAKVLAPDVYGDKVQHSGAIEHRAVVLLPQLVAAPALTPISAKATLAAGDDGSAPARQDGRVAAELTAPDNTGELSTS